MNMLRVSAWRGKGRVSTVYDCPGIEDVVRILTRPGLPPCCVVHLPDEQPRNPTPWEFKACRTLATAKAARLLRGGFSFSDLGDDIDSEFLRLSVTPGGHHPRDDLIRRAELAVERLPVDAGPDELARVAMRVAGKAPATVRRKLLEVVGLSMDEARAAAALRPKGPALPLPIEHPSPRRSRKRRDLE